MLTCGTCVRGKASSCRADVSGEQPDAEPSKSASLDLPVHFSETWRRQLAMMSEERADV
jgi:hypothetical protein